MSKKQLNLIYALKNETIVSIEDVDRGLECGCVCPACGEPLVAKKGTKVVHHFAHQTGTNCEYGYETSLHLAAKDILSKAKRMTIPAVYLQFPSHKDDILLSEAQEIDVERVELERKFDDVIPDVVVYSKRKAFFVEIFVTHRVNEVKFEKIKKANISTIEIDLSKRNTTISSQELADILLCNDERSQWIYNSVANRYLQKFYQVADKRDIMARGLALHVDYCPIKKKIWRGKSYADFLDDCLDCEYCILIDGEDFILCSGRQRIAELADFDVSKELRIAIYKRKQHEREQSLFLNLFPNGKCPRCRGKIRKRKGPYGVFWGCSNYPKCTFSESIW